MGNYLFTPNLVEGIIEKRKSQFTMIVNYNGDSISCHCPTTGRIGDIDVSGRPCLLSKSSDPKRKTPFTVEAVSLDRVEESKKNGLESIRMPQIAI